MIFFFVSWLIHSRILAIREQEKALGNTSINLVKKTHGHLYTEFVEKGFLREAITTLRTRKGHTSIASICEIPQNLDFSPESHSHPFYIKATTIMKMSRLELNAFVGLPFMSKFIFFISDHGDILQFRKHLNMYHFNGKLQVSFSDCYWQKDFFFFFFKKPSAFTKLITHLNS